MLIKYEPKAIDSSVVMSCYVRNESYFLNFEHLVIGPIMQYKRVPSSK